MAEMLGVTPAQAIAVVITTIAMYLVLLVLVRVMGQRTLNAMSTHDIACVIAIGAVIGRTTLLAEPTLAGGVIALVTLFVIQRVLGLVHRRRWFARLLARKPVLLMVGDEIRHDELRRARITPDELHQRLRLAGIGRPGQVGTVILEVNGQISVVRREPGLAPDLFDDVPGAARAIEDIRRDAR